MTLPLELAKLEQTAKAANDKEWTVGTDTTSDGAEYPVSIDGPEYPIAMFVEGADCTMEDAEHIATFNPATMKILFEVFREQQKALEQASYMGHHSGCDAEILPRDDEEYECSCGHQYVVEALASIRAKVSL